MSEQPDTPVAALQEPVMHAVTGSQLSLDHWLFAQWDAESASPTGMARCEQCGNHIFDRGTNQALRTWVETGLIRMGGDGPHVHMWCLLCFSTSSFVWPVALAWWGMLDGGPLPVYDPENPYMNHEQVDAYVHAEVASLLATEAEDES